MKRNQSSFFRTPRRPVAGACRISIVSEVYGGTKAVARVLKKKLKYLRKNWDSKEKILIY